VLVAGVGVDIETAAIIEQALERSKDLGSHQVTTAHLVSTICRNEPDAALTRALSVYGLGSSVIDTFLSQQLGDPFDKSTYSVGYSTALSHAMLLSHKDHGGKSRTVVRLHHLIDAVLSVEEPVLDRILHEADTNRHTLQQMLANTTRKRAASAGVPKTIAGFVNELTVREDDPPTLPRPDITTQVLKILARRSKANPVLIGDPGVGKTAIVEQLVTAVHDPAHADTFGPVAIWNVDLGRLVAGARMRGDTEERLTQLLDAVRSSDTPIWLFIDEIHTLFAAGGNDSGLSDLIKPVLARGDIRVIGATTHTEYRTIRVRDAALERRFTPVTVDEPSREDTVAMLTTWSHDLAAHHHVTIDPDAVTASVDLTGRWMPERRWPDKAVDTLDIACANVRVDHSSSAVTAATVTGVVAALADVDVAAVAADDTTTLASLKSTLQGTVVGQDHAIDTLVRAVQRVRCGLEDRNRPVSLLFAGPTGVGKTSLANAYAAHMSGKKTALITIDCAEYGQSHSVARLIGSPPGYVGYSEGGQLTEAIRRNKNAVILFDEFDKASPALADILLGLLDTGTLTDSSGSPVDASNTTIILTSNAGSSFTATAGFNSSDEQVTQQAQKKALEATRPEFANRLDGVVVFNPLTAAHLETITAGHLDDIVTRCAKKNVALTYTPAVPAWLAQHAYQQRNGARGVLRLVHTHVTDPVAELLVAGQSTSISVDVGPTGVTVASTSQQNAFVYERSNKAMPLP